jgi:hypothetical protein
MEELSKLESLNVDEVICTCNDMEGNANFTVIGFNDESVIFLSIIDGVQKTKVVGRELLGCDFDIDTVIGCLVADEEEL